MLFSNFMRVGLPACLLVLIIWTLPAFSKTWVYRSDDIYQLAAIVNQALEANPEIQATRSAVNAAKARFFGASLPLNNPELEMEAERTDINTYTIGVSQIIDWHDKRSAFEQVAAAELASAQARVDNLRLAKATELLETIGRIVVYNEITALSKRRTHIMDRFSNIAEQLHAAGDIPQTELELAHLSLAKAVMQHARNSSELIQARSDFFSLSGRFLNSGVKLPSQLPATLSDTQSETTLAQKHPRVQAAHQMAQAARRQIRAVDQERKADPTLGLTAGREDKENLIAISFSIPLQVRNNFRSNVDAAQAKALQAEQEAQHAYQSLLARLKGAKERYKLVASAWSIWLSRGIPSLQQRIELLEAQWRAGGMSTTEYILQVQQTLDTQIAGAELHGDLWNAWIEWLSASGTLNKWLDDKLAEQ